MATLHQVQAAIQVQIAQALSLLSPPPAIGIGWPSVELLQNNARKGAAGLVSIYDRKQAHNSTRWKPIRVGVTAIPPGVTSTVVGGTKLAAGQSTTIALGGSFTLGDAVSCVVWAPTLTSLDNAVIVQAGPTLGATATNLAAAINVNLNTLLTATANGSDVTLVAQRNVVVASYAGNGGSATREVARRARRLQVVVWANSEAQREAIGDPIEATLAELEVTNGVVLADGTVGRIEVENDFYLEDATLYDTLRRDFFIHIDYPITTQDTLYSVLAPILDFQLE